MALRAVSKPAAFPCGSFGLALVFALAAGACGEKNGAGGTADMGGQTATTDQGTSGPSVMGGQGAIGDQSTMAGQSTTGDQTGTDGSMAASGDDSSGGTLTGVSSSGGAANSGTPGAGSTGESTGGTSTSSDVGLGSAGDSDATSLRGQGSGGADSNAAGGSGGVALASGGAGGADDGGAGDSGVGAGGASNGECTRAFLDGLLDDYFAALSAGDPTSLPLAASVKFTENAQETEIGTTAFWMNAGDTKYSQRALDTGACSVAAQAVIPEGAVDLPVAVRIKVEAGEMTEIETIVVRQGDYTASFAVDSEPNAIIAIADEIGWHDEVPEADRATREELAAWIDKYFRAFPSGVCDVSPACTRLENGGGNFSCNAGASCAAGDSGAGGFVPRVIVVDEVRGIAAGLTIFDFMTTGHLDMHMIKMSGGEVHAVQAILRDTGGESGWD